MNRIRWVWTGAVAVLLAAVSVAHAGQWQDLHRPLHLSALASGEACPVSSVDQRIDWLALHIFGDAGIGSGPVYPGLGPDSHLNTFGEGVNGWFGTKVFWYARPRYRGPVLIRGRRLDGTDRLRFTAQGSRSSELRMPVGKSVQWPGQPPKARGKPSGVSIRASGCYGVQIDGTSFSRVVVFSASLP